MCLPHLARQLIPCLFFLLVLSARADRVKVALIDGEPVYHWTNFRSTVSDDVDRALILRAFRRQGFHLPEHFVDEAVQNKIKQDYGGDRAKLVANLKSHGETLASYRKYTAEEVILQAMLTRETKRPKNGHPPPTEAAWLASLRKGTKIRRIKPVAAEINDANGSGQNRRISNV